MLVKRVVKVMYFLYNQTERPAAQPSAPPSEVPNPVGPEESPPPYSTFEIGSPASIKCQVCQAVINIEGNQQNAVKCQECKESTVSLCCFMYDPAPINPCPLLQKVVKYYSQIIGDRVYLESL